MADREAFLRHIREQAARGRSYRVALNPDATEKQSYVGGGPDKVATLLAEWQAVGGRGARVTGEQAARAHLSALLAEWGTRRVVHWEHPLLSHLDVPGVCQAAGAQVRNWAELASATPDRRWPDAFAADLGITSVDYAIAETGSLALFSQASQGRVVSLLPPRALAIVEPGQILPDLFDLFTQLESRKSELPSNMVLVTGPSKTGDIELKLTTGVHGPGEVYLLVVEPTAG
ncbi:MAG: lactate utilization protein C [Planctomycetaceae bacterium]